MTTFIGAEYFIASILIEKRKNGVNSVTMEEMGKAGIYVQRLSVRENIDAVFLTSKSQLFNAIYDFSDYFEYETDCFGGIRGIQIKQSKSIDDLENRFMGYLPQKIVNFLSEAINDYAA